jgi:hypothetical protein
VKPVRARSCTGAAFYADQEQGDAELLGVKVNTLRYRMKKPGIYYSRGFSKKKGN